MSVDGIVSVVKIKKKQSKKKLRLWSTTKDIKQISIPAGNWLLSDRSGPSSEETKTH